MLKLLWGYLMMKSYAQNNMLCFGATPEHEKTVGTQIKLVVPIKAEQGKVVGFRSVPLEHTCLWLYYS
jgi:hypothetical protein